MRLSRALLIGLSLFALGIRSQAARADTLTSSQAEAICSSLPASFDVQATGIGVSIMLAASDCKDALRLKCFPGQLSGINVGDFSHIYLLEIFEGYALDCSGSCKIPVKGCVRALTRFGADNPKPPLPAEPGAYDDGRGKRRN
jgi:hypothetical protein